MIGKNWIGLEWTELLTGFTPFGRMLIYFLEKTIHFYATIAKSYLKTWICSEFILSGLDFHLNQLFFGSLASKYAYMSETIHACNAMNYNNALNQKVFEAKKECAQLGWIAIEFSSAVSIIPLNWLSLLILR